MKQGGEKDKVLKFFIKISYNNNRFRNIITRKK